jgi:hypothetical protein
MAERPTAAQLPSVVACPGRVGVLLPLQEVIVVLEEVISG